MNGIPIGEPIVNNAVDESYKILPNIDAKYGPYVSIQSACNILTKDRRAIGLTVGVNVGNEIKEFWFKDGIEDNQLVLKVPEIDLSDYDTSAQSNAKFLVVNNAIKATNNEVNKIKQDLADIEAESNSPYTRSHMKKLHVKISGVPTGTYTIRTPNLKYNAENVISFTTDDANASTLSVIWAAINKRPISVHSTDIGSAGKTYQYHANQYLAGDIPQDIILKTFTDYLTYETPFGRERIKQGVAIWPYAGNDGGCFMDRVAAIDKNANNLYRFMMPYLLWEDCNLICRYGVDLYYHNIGTEAFGASSDIYNVIQGLIGDLYKTKTMTGRIMKIIARPDGNNVYMDAMLEMSKIDMAVAENSPAEDCKPFNQTEWYHKVWSRRFSDDIDGELKTTLATLYSTAVADKKWFHFCCHTATGTWADFVKFISDTYGDISHKTWFTTVGELYEFEYFKKHNRVLNFKTGNNVIEFDYEFTYKENFNYRDISLVFDGVNVSSLSGITIEAYDLYDSSYVCPIQQLAVYDNKLWLLLGVEDSIIDNIEYFVSKYEETEDTLWKDDAEFELTKIDADRRNTFQNRINSISSKVPITAITSEDNQLSLTDMKAQTLNIIVTPTTTTERNSIKWKTTGNINLEVTKVSDTANGVSYSIKNTSRTIGSYSGNLIFYTENPAVESNAIPISVVVNGIAMTSMTLSKSSLGLVNKIGQEIEIVTMPVDNTDIDKISVSVDGTISGKIDYDISSYNNSRYYLVKGITDVIGSYTGRLEFSVEGNNSIEHKFVDITLTVNEQTKPITGITVEAPNSILVNQTGNIAAICVPVDTTEVDKVTLEFSVNGAATIIDKTIDANVVVWQVKFIKTGVLNVIIKGSGITQEHTINVKDVPVGENDKIICGVCYSYRENDSVVNLVDTNYGGTVNMEEMSKAAIHNPDMTILKTKSGKNSQFTRNNNNVPSLILELGGEAYTYIPASAADKQNGNLTDMFSSNPLYKYINKYNGVMGGGFCHNAPNGNYQIRFISSTTEQTDAYGKNNRIFICGVDKTALFPTAPYQQKNEWTDWIDCTVTDGYFSVIFLTEKSARVGINAYEIKILD